MIRPWTGSASRKLGDYRVFTVRSTLRRPPKPGPEHEFFVIDSVDWVNVIALTPDHQMVLVEQFRHGVGQVELEIPGGMIDAGDASPGAAGARELREETGFTGEAPVIVGTVHPNPAIMSNTCHTVLIQNCRPGAPLHFDATEDIETRLAPVDEVLALAAAGKIRHALVIAALFHFEHWRRTHPRA